MLTLERIPLRTILTWPFGWAIWYSYWMGYRSVLCSLNWIFPYSINNNPIKSHHCDLLTRLYVSHCLLNCWVSPTFPTQWAGPSTIYGSSSNTSHRSDQSEIERSPRTVSKPMYGTRLWCLVQAITWHTCPDPHLGSWNCLPHQAHIAPSEPMSSIDQQGSSLGSFPTLPSPLSPL